MIDMNSYEAIKSVLHEPNRLALVSLLATRPDGVGFRQLRDELNLTDGNLSCHLRTLEDSGHVSIEKSFVGRRAHSQICLTESGREALLDYLVALRAVCARTEAALERTVDRPPGGRRAPEPA